MEIISGNLVVESYLKAIKSGDFVAQAGILNSLLKIDIDSEFKFDDEFRYTTTSNFIWYRIVELGGLDFRFERYTQKINSGKLITKRFQFTYKNGRVKFKNGLDKIPRYVLRGCSEMRDRLETRIPNLKDYTFHHQMYLNIYTNSFLNIFDNDDALISDKLISKLRHGKAYLLFIKFNKKISLDIDFLEYDRLVDEMIDELYRENYYTDIINPKLHERILNLGWKVMDDKSEYRKIFFSSNFNLIGKIFVKNGEYVFVKPDGNLVSIYTIGSGGIDTPKLILEMSKNNDSSLIINPETGQINLRYNQLDADQDYYL